MPGNARRSRTILLVEESPLRRQMLSKELSRRGYLVVAVETVGEALEQLVHAEADLVALALDLSRRGVRQQVDNFRRRSRTRDLPVVLYSATLRRHLASLRGRAPGQQDWLEEVVDLHAVPQEVEAWLARPARPRDTAPLAVRGAPRRVRDTETGAPPRPLERGAEAAPCPEPEPGTDEELRALAEKLQQDPWNPEVLGLYAARLYARERWEDLVEVCDRLLAVAHEPGLYTFYQGDAFYRLGRIEAAILAWERSLSLDPEGPHAPKARRRIEVALRFQAGEEPVAG